MSATKNKAKASNASANASASASVPANAAGMDVLTLAEAAAYFRLSEEDMVRLVREQGLPGRRVDHQWRFLKAALQEWLRTPPPPNAPENLMQWAGAFQNDPDLKEIVREAYRQRGRPMAEEGE